MKKLIFYSCLLLISISASAQVPGYVPTNGLEGFWPFNGNANDVSGNNNNGFVSNAVLTADKSGIANSAYNFNGTNARIVTTNAPTLTGNYSISAWFNTQSLASWGTIVDCRPNAASGIGIEHNSNLSFTTSTGSSYNNTMSNFSIQTNTWLHVVVVYNGTHKLIYINGVLDKTQLYSNLILSTTQPFIFGDRGIMPSGPGNYFNGTLDDIGIWNRSLTQSEVTALYNQAPNPVLPSNVPTSGLVAYYPFNGNANDESGNGNNGTNNGGTMTTDRNSVANSAYSFDGVNDYIIGLSNSFPTNQRTVSVWFFSNNIGIGNLGRGVLGYGGNTCGESWNMHLDNPGSPLGLNSYEVNTHCNAFSVTSSYGSLIPNGNWHNWVVSTNPNGTYFYLDGNLIQSSNLFINNTVVANKNFVFGTFTNPNGIGASINDPNNTVWNGKLDDIGIWNRALTQSEITALYNTPTAAASDSLWVINKQTDTLAFPSQVKLSLKSNNITSKNISAYDIKLNYDASKLKFDSVNKTNTASANGSIIVNSSTTGQVIIGWASSSSISSATLPLLNCFFTPIDSGKTTVSISSAIFNTDTVKNRYSKSVINKFNFGDVDMNKIIQSYDASVVLKYSIGIDPLPTVDPLPWEPWRIKVASVDSAVAVDANDASLILKYSVGLITKFPKRGISSAPGYVTVNLENNELVVRSFEDMGGLNITFLDHLSDLGAPTYVHNTNALSAFNKQANMYKIGVAFSEAPINGTVILRIPYTGLGNQTLNMELVENTAARNYQLNVVTGINDIKNSNIKIYPNPTNNIINIEGLTKNENNTIQIFDVQGKLVITKTINEKGTIDLSELNKGVYVIKIGEVAQRIVMM